MVFHNKLKINLDGKKAIELNFANYATIEVRTIWMS